MAVALVQQSNQIATTGSGATAQLTFGSAFSAGQHVVVEILSYPGTEISSVADNQGNTYTKAISAIGGGGFNRAGIWYANNIATAGTTPVVTITCGESSGNYVTAKAAVYSGVATSSVLVSTGSANTWTNSLTVTTSGGSPVAGDLVVTALIANEGAAANGLGYPSGYTGLFQQQDSENTSGGQAAYKTATVDGAQSATHTANANRNYIAIIAVFKAASGSTAKTLITSLSAAVQLARSATATVSAAVQTGRTGAASLDVAAAVTRTAQSSLDAALQRAASAAAGVDAATQIARTAGAGADTAVQILRSAGTTLDAVAQLARAASAAVDVQVQAAAALTTSLSVQVQEGGTSTTSLDVATRYARNADAALDVVTQLPRSAAHVVDVAVRRSAALTLTASAAVQAAASLGVGLDVQVQGGQTVAAVVQAAVQEARSAALGLQVAIAQAAGASTSVSAAVALQRALSAAVDAAVMGVGAAAVGTSVYVVDASEYTDGPSGHGPTSAVIAARRGRQHQRINVASHGRPRQRNTTR